MNGPFQKPIKVSRPSAAKPVPLAWSFFHDAVNLLEEAQRVNRSED